ncbi:alpha-1,2-mannosidase, putative [Lentimicrobium saccharophilum]|uniref:Alpha-1,2-mannosidase, putative n=1 Tax=Lentimicrobium saccharophilum TaxID=1678841 RepID=A0A0S7BXD8_9BACT|nr:GH92 family glycosyl hydrolase [Lentimicrobium saccharophilum]GAP42209.1 alpha-1,2-mannosidase, putative [Lentimicrobium saccharophilum]
MKKLLPAIMFSLCLTAFSQSVADYVNPFTGTDHMGHTYPGATVPFGMVQLSPDTDTVPYSTGAGYKKEVYAYCAGYQYSDNTICGFSHTHFSGTGHSDLGDFLLIPTTGPLKLNPGTKDNPDSGYRSRFSHERESASPGYYSVMLDDYGILAELTTTERVGVHRYTSHNQDDINLILDMSAGIYNYPGKNTWQFIRVENDTLVTGYRQTRGWARTRTMYFAMAFSKPLVHYGHENGEEIIYRGFYRKFNEKEDFPEMAGKDITAWFRFRMQAGEQLTVRVALSPVSTAGALNNLQTEAPRPDFDLVRLQAHERWNEELSRIQVEGSLKVKQNFYTSLYHTFLSPTIYMDVDGKYRGLDQNIHQAEGFTNYSTFSLWDTYRALHPLFTLVQQERTSSMIRSMLAHRKQSVHGILPVWSHHANENWCMTGYHAIPVIADAYLKGIGGFDAAEALEAMDASATYAGYDGIGEYMQYGYAPADLTGNSATKTLEYAYDDWCIARTAEKAGQRGLTGIYHRRARSFENIYDRSTGFMRPRLSDGSWQKEFDPLKTEGQGFIEGNAWNYSLYVPHDPAQLIAWAGGSMPFVRHLDSLFTMKLDEKHIEDSEDIDKRGIIGNYVHGNEPSHHVPYLYSFAGAPAKTQERVHQIMDALYQPTPGGLPGNDDCGQMSAWYIFSALGFYPVCPGSNEYVLGSPSVSRAEIRLENGKTFAIQAKGLSEKNIFVKKITLNGKPWSGLFIRHEDIMAGGEMVFEMSSKPAKIKVPESDLPGRSF